MQAIPRPWRDWATFITKGRNMRRPFGVIAALCRRTLPNRHTGDIWSVLLFERAASKRHGENLPSCLPPTLSIQLSETCFNLPPADLFCKNLLSLVKTSKVYL